MKCPKCGEETADKDVCPKCNYRIEEEENQVIAKLKDFAKRRSFLLEAILAVIIVIMFVIAIGMNGEKENLQRAYKELQTKSDDTAKTLQARIDEKDKEILENQKKISELQQEEKQNEIHSNITSLESEKQKLETEKKTLEQEKQTLSTQIEELKKTSSTVTQSKTTASKEIDNKSAAAPNSDSTTKPTATQNGGSTTKTTEKTTPQNTNSTIVYVTNTGKKYHKSGCSYLKKSKIEMSLTSAKNSGYTPCSRCY